MKTSSIVSMAAFAILFVAPSLSWVVNRDIAREAEKSRIAIADSISAGKVRCIELDGKDLNRRMLSVDKSGSRSVAELRTCVESASLDRDTLRLSLDYPGRIFWGTLRLNNLEKAIFPNDTLNLISSQK